jgi:hypothetical protein
MIQALKLLPEKAKQNLVVMAKAPPCDWQPFFPYNPLWSQWGGADDSGVDLGGLPMVMELDLGLETLGQNTMVMQQVEFIRLQVEQASMRGAIGITARIERSCLTTEMSKSASSSCRYLQPNTKTLGSPNALNLLALARFQQGGHSADDVWAEWSRDWLGAATEEALAVAKQAVEPTFEAVSRAWFPMKQWTTQHSNLPKWAYVLECLTGYTAPSIWVPSPTNAMATNSLLRPSPFDLQCLKADQAPLALYINQSIVQLEASIKQAPSIWQNGSVYKQRQAQVPLL